MTKNHRNLLVNLRISLRSLSQPSWLLLPCCVIIAHCQFNNNGCYYTNAFAFSPTDVPPLLDVPTYSLATLNDNDKDDVEQDNNEKTTTSTTNMNILTYASPVSVKPDRIWAIGLYKETLSYRNFMRERRGILQILCDPYHINLVSLLGGKSGSDINKEEECTKLGWKWVKPPQSKEDSTKLPLFLPKCIKYLELSLLDDNIIDAGSHVIAICRVDSMFIDDTEDDDSDNNGDLLAAKEEKKTLSTSTLRDLGIITEQGRVA